MLRARLPALAASLLSATSLAQAVYFGDKPTRDATELPPSDAGTVPKGAQADLVPEVDAGVDRLVSPRLKRESPAPYPPDLAQSGISGEVLLHLLVDEQGEVAEVELVQGEDPLLNASAMHAATRLGFEPATLDGVPQAVRVPFTYRFAAPVLKVSSETAVLSGVVRTRGNRRPIAQARVTADADESLAAETDAEGRFRLEVPPGEQRFRVFAAGHKPGEFKERLKVGDSLQVVYGLESLNADPYETIVVGERDRTEVSRMSLREQEIREVPGTLGDPFRVVMLLPGVGSVASGIAYPVVRGSQPASTGYYLDGVKVPLLFHLFLGPAVVHPDFLDGVDFFPGHAPVRFGRNIGGVVEGIVSKPREDRFHATAYADLLNAGGFVEYPVKETGTNFTLSGRYSYSALIAGVAATYLTPAPAPPQSRPAIVLDFYDYQARVEQKWAGGVVRLLGFGSSDVFGTRSDNLNNSVSTQAVTFHRLDLRYQKALWGGTAEAGLTFGVDHLGNDGRNLLQVSRFGFDQGNLIGRVSFQKELRSNVKLSMGGDFERRDASISFTEGVISPITRSETSSTHRTPVAIGALFGTYGQLILTPWSRWTLVPGLRLDSYHLVPGVTRLTAEPRLTARYTMRENLTLKGGAGLFHQPPAVLINLPAVDTAGIRYGLQEALQFDVGAEWKLSPMFHVNVDAYVNPLLHALELPLGQSGSTANAQSIANNPLAQPYTDTTGYAYGLELLLRKPLGGNWFGWVSYTLSRSVRYQSFYRYNAFGDVVGKAQGYLPYVFDQTHIFNGVVSYRFGNGVTFGAVLHFNTGRPEYPLGQTRRKGVGPFGEPEWILVDADKNDRLPPFFRVDLRLAKSWAFETFTLDAYLDFLNASISREVISVSYSGGGSDLFSPGGSPLTKQYQGIPIVLPMLGVKGTY